MLHVGKKFLPILAAEYLVGNVSPQAGPHSVRQPHGPRSLCHRSFSPAVSPAQNFFSPLYLKEVNPPDLTMHLYSKSLLFFELIFSKVCLFFLFRSGFLSIPC